MLVNSEESSTVKLSEHRKPDFQLRVPKFIRHSRVSRVE